MGQVWTREDWNDLIGRINDLADAGCEIAEPLEEVPEGHIWSIQDITDARNLLTEICSNAPDFSGGMVKWTQAIIDELNGAIDNCECGGCTQALVDDIQSLNGQASYVYHTYGNVQWLYNEWYDEGDRHWHFQWTYKQDYDYTVAIGMGYGQEGMHGVGHTVMFHLDWVYWPYSGPTEFLSSDEEMGTVGANCDGMVTTAPAGTYVKTFPVDYRLLMQPTGYPHTLWSTAGAGCC